RRRHGHDLDLHGRQDRRGLAADLPVLRARLRARRGQHVHHPDRHAARRQGLGRRLVAVEPDPGDAGQYRRRLRLHRPRALRDLQASRACCCGGLRRAGGCGIGKRAPRTVMKIETPTNAGDFSDEQKRYLEGFMSGLQVGRVGRNLGSAASSGKADAEPSGPEAAHIKAQDKVTASGKKLVDQEKFKREEHPFDAYPRLKQQALDNAAPSPADNFRWRYFGLFYVAPAQDSYMCRLRIPNGILKHWQFSGLADLAERLSGPYSHVTTRANVQLREIPFKHAVKLIEGIQDLGLCSRGSGADNIRNVTGTPTAGIDPQELLDTRPF